MAYRKIHSNGEWREEELVAAAGITPGHLCEINSAGTVQVHSTEGGRAERMFAYEDQLQGKTVSDAYVATDQVFLMLPYIGGEVNLLLAIGENVAIGDELISAGDGTVKALSNISSGVTVEAGGVIAIALEAQDNSGGSAAVLTKCRVVA
jgi:hypothetical protein